MHTKCKEKLDELIPLIEEDLKNRPKDNVYQVGKDILYHMKNYMRFQEKAATWGFCMAIKKIMDKLTMPDIYTRAVIVLGWVAMYEIYDQFIEELNLGVMFSTDEEISTFLKSVLDEAKKYEPIIAKNIDKHLAEVNYAKTRRPR